MVYWQRWHGWCHTKLLPSRRVLCTPYNHASCRFMQSHIRKVHAYLVVTCHLHFWQNDRGLLRATAVTRGWKGYKIKSQHRKLTLEKKIVRPLLQRFEPATFRSRVRRSNHWAIPALMVRSTLSMQYTASVRHPLTQSQVTLALCLVTAVGRISLYKDGPAKMYTHEPDLSVLQY